MRCDVIILMTLDQIRARLSSSSMQIELFVERIKTFNKLYSVFETYTFKSIFTVCSFINCGKSNRSVFPFYRKCLNPTHLLRYEEVNIYGWIQFHNQTDCIK